MSNQSIPITDAHTHLWDPSEVQYDWLESVPSLNRAFVLSDYDQATEGMGIERMVFVEPNANPSDNLKEVEWVEKLAAQEPRLQGIVAYVDLNAEQSVDQQLELLGGKSLVKGIRHNIQFNDPGFALQKSFVDGIGKVHQQGMHFELCLTHDQLPEVNDLLNCLDSEIPLMLDHCAKPGIKAGEIENWKQQMTKLAANKNLCCKISGLLTEADLENWTQEEMIPYLDHCLDVFGMDRIVFGGDWPVSELAGGYSAWYDLITAWTSPWSQAEKLAFFHDNAGRFYRL